MIKIQIKNKTLFIYFRILLRVSQSLKSQARDVRDVARDTLKKIASSLGSDYLSTIFKEMRIVLQRGIFFLFLLISSFFKLFLLRGQKYKFSF